MCWRCPLVAITAAVQRWRHDDVAAVAAYVEAWRRTEAGQAPARVGHPLIPPNGQDVMAAAAAGVCRQGGGQAEPLGGGEQGQRVVPAVAGVDVEHGQAGRGTSKHADTSGRPMCPPVGDAALVDAGGSTSARDKRVLSGVFALSTAPARASTVTGRPGHREDGPTETGVSQGRLQARAVVQLIECQHHNVGVSSSLANWRWGSWGALLLVPHEPGGHRCQAAGPQRSSRDLCQLAPLQPRPVRFGRPPRTVQLLRAWPWPFRSAGRRPRGLCGVHEGQRLRFRPARRAELPGGLSFDEGPSQRVANSCDGRRTTWKCKTQVK